MVTFTDRMDMGYLPSDGELLSSYVNRLKTVVEQNRYTYAPAHEKWYTHRGNAPCFICNFMDCCDYLVAIIKDMSLDSTYYWKCVRPAGEKEPLKFDWKPFKRAK